MAKLGDEPRGLTPGDRVALGVGLGLGLLTLPAWVAMARNFPWLGVGIFLRNSLGFWLLAVVLGVVALGRAKRYGRLPRPAEWLALTFCAWGLATMLPPASHEELTSLILWPLIPLNLTHVTGRWVAFGVISLGILLGWQVARVGRGVLPAVVRAGWLTFLILLAIWSPLTTLGLHAADWFAPAGGFGRGDAMTLYRGVCQWAAQTPLALLVGWPAVATVEARLAGRPSSWNETAAALGAALAALIAGVVFRGEFGPLTLPGLAERVIAVAWLTTVARLDLHLIRWSRGLDRDSDVDAFPPVDQPGAPRAGSARAAVGSTER